ncbi:MAG: TIGR03960 family B12-binding radical SAM protein [Clostridiales bacterium]|nr:TIGR03960 family B12-binding radical SAM protein [Clostridiales bacterium]
MLAAIDRLLPLVEKPARYIGGEMNTDIKERQKETAAFAFCFPDSYEVAMSHLGMKILYHILNKQPDMLCERVMMPWVDMSQLLKDKNIPLFSLESRTALYDFDVVGFTLQYEMSFTNVLEMLSLGGIPVLSSERGEDMPIVIAGGPCAFNPEPLANFMDAFVIGDAATAIVEVTALIKRMRLENKPRKDILLALAQIEGCYVPSLYETTYHEDGTISSFRPLNSSVPPKIRKRLELDLENLDFPDAIPVPFTEIVHDRVALEIMRGCTRGCRFCQAGMLYRPVRERSPQRLVELAEKLIKATGYEQMSLTSLSSGDYGQLAELIRELMDRFSDKKVSLSLPSMRVDSLLKDSLEQVSEIKKSGLTLAPEAATQRLRDVINKGITEEDIRRSVSDAFESGWSSVKLYFMNGLPTETEEDLIAYGDMARLVIDAYHQVPKGQRSPGLRISLSSATFVPKAFTPFQWDAQDTLETIKHKQRLLRDTLRIKGITFNWSEPELSLLEACIARGDRRMGDVIYKAWQLGCKMDGWREFFKYDMWMQAFADCGIDPAFYANRQRGRDEILPWDFVDIGVTKKYLWLERESALSGIVTPDCRNGCDGCGLTRFEGACVS